jgi:hypothetical protein
MPPMTPAHRYDRFCANLPCGPIGVNLACRHGKCNRIASKRYSLKATLLLLQIDGLIVAAPIEFRAPYFVHSLVLGPTVVNRRPKSQIQVPQPLQ